MKRALLIIILFILPSVQLLSESFVGGAVSSCKVGGSRSVNVIPEFGYYFNPHNAISISLAYATFFDSQTNVTNQTLQVTPNYRYAFTKKDNWQFDINASIGYSRFFKSNANRLGIYLGPQLEYFLKTNWTLWISFDAFSIETDWFDKNPNTISTAFNWFNNGFNIG